LFGNETDLFGELGNETDLFGARMVVWREGGKGKARVLLGTIA
jgi:hypothetical protein